MSQPTIRRRKIVVDAALQFGLSFRLLGWVGAYALGFAALVTLPALWQGLTEPGGSVADALLDRLAQITAVDAVALLVVTTLFVLHGVAFTHRLAGPVFRFKQTLREMATGRIPERVSLRKADYMQDLARELSLLCMAQRSQATRQRSINAETQIAARKLLTAVGRPDLDAEELVLLAHKVLSSAERLDRHIPFVHSEDDEYESTTESDALAPDPVSEVEAVRLEPLPAQG